MFLLVLIWTELTTYITLLFTIQSLTLQDCYENIVSLNFIEFD